MAGSSGRVVECVGCGVRARVPVQARGRARCPKCKTDLPWIVSAGSADFDAAVDTPLLTLVDLWAPWCGPCRMVSPVVERLAGEFVGRLKVVKVNVDDAPDIQARFQVQGIPTLLLMRDGHLVDRVVGAQGDAQLRRWVDANI